MCLAVPGRIESLSGDTPETRTGRVNFGGVVKSINLAFVPEAQVGDYVLAHVGFAISRISDDEARRTLDALEGRT